MAWSTPVTAVAGVKLTAAQWNASVRDNLLETAPAKATTAGRHIVTSGPLQIAERAILDDIINTTGTRTSTSYGNLTGGGTGPTVTVTTGPALMVFMNARMEPSNTAAVWTSFAISGATSDSAIDERALLLQGVGGDSQRMGCTSLNAVNAGSNTVQMQYKASTGGELTCQDRRLVVMAL